MPPPRPPPRPARGGDDTFSPWTYTVYTRRIEIRGHEAFARDIFDWELPDSVHMEIELDQVRAAGR
jgi:ribosomal protein S10